MILQTSLTILGFLFSTINNTSPLSTSKLNMDLVVQLNPFVFSSDDNANSYTIENTLELLGTLEYEPNTFNFTYTIYDVNVYCTQLEYDYSTREISAIDSFVLERDDSYTFTYTSTNTSTLSDFLDVLNNFTIVVGSENPNFYYEFNDGVNSVRGSTNSTAYSYYRDIYCYETKLSFNYWSIYYQLSGISDFAVDGNSIYTTGYDEGKQVGYDEGYNDGYNEGFTADITAVTIFNGILNIGLVPINFFLGIFNYEILGINVSSFVSALLSVALIIIVVRMVTGKKNE